MFASLTIHCWCGWYLSCRIKRALHLHLAAMDTDINKDFVSGVSRCFVYLRRILTSNDATVVDQITSVEHRTKRTRFSEPSAANNLPAEHDYWKLFCPHKVKVVDFLRPMEEGHLVAVTDIGGWQSVAVADNGIRCSAIVTWTTDDDDDEAAVTVSRTAGCLRLHAKDIVSPQFSLLFNTSSVLSGMWAHFVSTSAKLLWPYSCVFVGGIYFIGAWLQYCYSQYSDCILHSTHHHVVNTVYVDQTVAELICPWYQPAIPKIHYSEGLVFRKSIVQIRATVLMFGLKSGLKSLGLGSALRLSLGLVGIVDFWNSGPSE